MIIVDAVSVVKSEKKILDTISLAIEQGSITSIIGPSGCGKTTLLRSIAGLTPLQAGSICINSVTITPRCTPSSNNLDVSMMFQDLALFPHMTVEQNIQFTQKTATYSENIQDKLLDALKIKQYKHVYPNRLSIGQQQRVALAACLLSGKKYILLDEPFSSQDQMRREQLVQTVRQFVKTHNLTVIMITHDQREAFVGADYIGIMNNGKLIDHQASYKAYHQPKTIFSANFTGQCSFLPIESFDAQKKGFNTPLGFIPYDNSPPKNYTEYSILIRPDDISIHPYSANHNSGRKLVKITGCEFLGPSYVYCVEVIDTSLMLHVIHPSHFYFKNGSVVEIELQARHIILLREQDES